MIKLKNSRYMHQFEEATIMEVLKAFLVDGKSHRQIQREILGMPAPARGGGFIAMDILHHFGINGSMKGVFFNKDIPDEVANLPEKFVEAIRLVKVYNYETQKAIQQIKLGNFKLDTSRTESKHQTTIRINQSVLRRYVIDLYGKCCALCNIDKEDLLVCSHIVPWSVDVNNRLNPANCICFCVLHDKLFDKGYFSLDANYNLIFGKKADNGIRELLYGLTFKKPARYLPDINLLKYHYDEVCN